MKIVIAGGTGLIGKPLVETLSAAQHEVVVLSRSAEPRNATHSVRFVAWDGKTLDSWANHIDGADAVVNLAGESIGGKRWTSKQKEKILASRLDATGVIVDAIGRAKVKPSVLVNGSAVGYYGNVEHDDVTESYQRGDGFLSDVCEKWESKARVAEKFGVRVAMLRTGVVLAEDGGALEKMALPYKMFVGAPLGSGKQWFPWIHRDDILNIVLFLLSNPDIAGPVNVAAPESATMKQFCSALGKAMHRPSWPPVPGFVLKIALGEMSEMLLTGQKIIPSKLQRYGYSFLFPKLDRALAEIFH